MDQRPTIFYQASPPAQSGSCHYRSPGGGYSASTSPQSNGYYGSPTGASPLRSLNYKAPSAVYSPPEAASNYSPSAPPYQWGGLSSPQDTRAHFYSPGPEYISPGLKRRLEEIKGSGQPLEYFEYLTCTPSYIEPGYVLTRYSERYASPLGLREATSHVFDGAEFPDSPSGFVGSPRRPVQIVTGLNSAGVNYLCGVIGKDGRFDRAASEAARARQQAHNVDEKLIEIGDDNRRFRRALKDLIDKARRAEITKFLGGFLNRFKKGVQSSKAEQEQAIKSLEQQERAAYNRPSQGQYTPPLTRGAERRRAAREEAERNRAHAQLKRDIWGSDSE